MYGWDEEAHPDKCCWISLTFKTPAECKRKLLNRLLWCVFCYRWTLNYNALAVLGRDDTRLSKRCKTKNKNCLRWPPSENVLCMQVLLLHSRATWICFSAATKKTCYMFKLSKHWFCFIVLAHTLLVVWHKRYLKKKNTIESRCVVWSKHYVTATISKLPPCLRIVKVF